MSEKSPMELLKGMYAVSDELQDLCSRPKCGIKSSVREEIRSIAAHVRDLAQSLPDMSIVAAGELHESYFEGCAPILPKAQFDGRGPKQSVAANGDCAMPEKPCNINPEEF